MKKTLIAFLSVVVVVFSASCGKQENAETKNENATEVAVQDESDLTTSVGGRRFDVLSPRTGPEFWYGWFLRNPNNRYHDGGHAVAAAFLQALGRRPYQYEIDENLGRLLNGMTIYQVRDMLLNSEQFRDKVFNVIRGCKDMEPNQGDINFFANNIRAGWTLGRLAKLISINEGRGRCFVHNIEI